MFDTEQTLIIECMEKNGNTDVTRALDECNIPILSARDYYGHHASDKELVPFQKATKILIEAEVLVSTISKLIISAIPEKYYLDLTKIR